MASIKTYGNKTCSVRCDLSGGASGIEVGRAAPSVCPGDVSVCEDYQVKCVHWGCGTRFLLSLNLFAILETLIGRDTY